MKILIVSRAKLGDMLLTTPMLRVLRNAMPSAEVHLLCNDHNAWIVDGNPCVDRRWVYGRTRVGRRIHPGVAIAQLKMYWDLRREHIDCAIVGGGYESHRAISRARYAKPARLVSYAQDPAQVKRVTDAFVPDASLHESERMARLLAPLGIEVPATLPYPEFQPPAQLLNDAKNWLDERKLTANRFFILGIGGRDAYNQLSTQQIVRLATRLKEGYGLDTVFMWTPGAPNAPLYPGDDAIAAPVVAMGLPFIHPFRGPLKQAIGLTYFARSSMFPNSGLMHAAATSPGGVMGIFANTTVWDAAPQWKPLGPRVQYVETDAPSIHAVSDDAIMGKLALLLRN
jgi:heptosyltransferase III